MKILKDFPAFQNGFFSVFHLLQKELTPMSCDPRCARITAGTSKFHALYRQLTQRVLDDTCARLALPVPLCAGDFDVLSLVARSSKSISMIRIARTLDVNPSSVSRSMKRLMEDGLVSRQTDPDDERRFLLAMLPLGCKVYDEMDARLHAAIAAMFEQIPPEHWEIVYGCIDRCLESMQDILNAKE